MLDSDTIKRIEDQAVNAYYESIDSSDFYDEEVIDYYDERIDVDKYNKVRGRCIVPGDVKYQWLSDSDFVYDYLKSKYNINRISETADTDILSNSGSFYDYCIDFCNQAREHWEESNLPDFIREYFLAHCEEY